MKMRELAKAILAGALLVSGGVAGAANVWAPKRYVTHIYPSSAGFIFMLDGAAIGPANCANRFKVPLSNPGYDAIVSSVITAFAAGYPIEAVYDDASGCDAIVDRVLIGKS